MASLKVALWLKDLLPPFGHRPLMTAGVPGRIIVDPFTKARVILDAGWLKPDCALIVTEPVTKFSGETDSLKQVLIVEPS